MVVDFEMNQVFCENKSHSEIIQIGAVIFDQEYNKIQTYESLVKSSGRVRKIVSEITGITDRELRSADNFKGAISKFFSWADRYSVSSVVSWGNSDKSVLVRQCRINNIAVPSYILNSWIDVQRRISNELTTLKKQLQLNEAATIVNIRIPGKSHNALYDARCLSEIICLRGKCDKRYIENTIKVNKTRHINEINILLQNLQARKSVIDSKIEKIYNTEITEDDSQESRKNSKNLEKLIRKRECIESKIKHCNKEMVKLTGNG